MKMPQMSFTCNEDIKFPPSLQLPKLFSFLAFPRKLYPSLIKLLFLKKSDKTKTELGCDRLEATRTI